MYSLFLDDLRTPDMIYTASTAQTFVVIRSYIAFVDHIEKHGLPAYISFDNDLGLDTNNQLAPDGYAAAKWLVYESGLDLKDLRFYVHSANPVAAEQIRGLLTNYIQFLNQKTDWNRKFNQQSQWAVVISLFIISYLLFWVCHAAFLSVTARLYRVGMSAHFVKSPHPQPITNQQSQWAAAVFSLQVLLLV